MKWEAMVARYGQSVFHAAWRVLRHVQEAEDVAQDVLLEFFRSGRKEGDSGLLPRMAVLRAVDRLRCRKRGEDIDGVPIAARDAGPVEEAIGRELVDRLQAAVADLPSRQAQVFCLRYLHDASYEQIAESLHISRDAVAVALHQA